MHSQYLILLSELVLVAEHLVAQHSAIKMLDSRVKLILKYVEAVEKGELEGNQEVLRAACSLSHRLPVLNSQKFKSDFYNVIILYFICNYKTFQQIISQTIFLFQQCNDFGLMTYLGIVTKGCNDTNQFVNKFNILYDRQGVARRLRSLFF